MNLKLFSFALIGSLHLLESCGPLALQTRSFSLKAQTEVTRDIGSSIEEVIEFDTIKTACSEYFLLLDDHDDPIAGTDPIRLKRLEILCGKWLFIGWETSGKLPLPEILFDAIKRSWPDRVGKNFEKIGFLPNPANPAGRPLGVARSTTRYTGMPSVNVTCAACHVGRLPDGRYAIGAPNHELNLSEFNLMSYYPLYAAMHQTDRQRLPPEAQTYYDRLERTERKRVTTDGKNIDWSNIVFKYSKLLRWLGIGPKGLADAKFVVMPPDRDLMSWIKGKPGVFNPGAPMLTLQVPDVPNLSIPQLWGITGYAEDFEAGKVAPLGQTTKYASLEKFTASAYIYAYQDMTLIRPRHIRPLVAYLRQLKTPLTKESLSIDKVQHGQQLFSANCKTCHNGIAGESTQLYRAELTGTHSSLENPRQDYKATTPIAKLIDDLSEQLAAELKPQPVGIRSRRLTGIWSRKYLMIDGSVDDLEDLFCLKGSRTQANSPHQDLCLSFDEEQKKNLMAYLKSL